MNKKLSKKPKIGIRAIIDGRCNGVREALEKNTMAIANLVAKLITDNLYYIDGSPVSSVVSPTTIGGVVEASECSDYFKEQNVCSIIDVSYAWAYASEILEMDSSIPKAIWGFNGSERPGSVYLAGAIAAAEQKGYPVFKIYNEDVQDPNDLRISDDIKGKLLTFAKASIALATIKNKSYLSIGGVSMGIGGSIVSTDLFEEYFGMRNEFIDMTELVRRIDLEIYDTEEYKRAFKWVKENCKETKDPNIKERQQSPEKKEEVWETVVKMTLICRDLMVGNEKLKEIGYPEESFGHNAIVSGFQGQRQWTDYFPNGDFMESILNSSFDWNGIRKPYIVATENDSLNGLSMLLGHCLTNQAQIFADVRTYWSPDAIKRVSNVKLPKQLEKGFIYLTNSGSAALDGSGEMSDINNNPTMKPYWEITKEEADKCIKKTQWGAGKLQSFRGGGFSSSFKTKGGIPITMMRLNLVKGLGPVLQIAEGHTIDLTDKIEEIIVKRCDPTWPKTFFVPRLTGKGVFESVYSVMEAWGSNHCSFTANHIGAELLTLASMLRIPVAMHNVDRKDIFRPSAWKSFGTADIEGADFRACKNYGPLYKK